MTLPKKSRKSIVVDGVEFHWTRGRSPENMWVTAQHGDGRGSLLRIDAFGIPVPNDIADAIRFAIQSGWQPASAGPMFFIGFTDREDHPRFVMRSSDSPDFWREFSDNSNR